MTHIRSSKAGSTSTCSPRHVAIIMDGNRRWAASHGKSKMSGYRAGIKSIHQAIRFAMDHQLSALTLYAFSSENWNRPRNEVLALMDLFTDVLGSTVNHLRKHDIRFKIIGDTSCFGGRLGELIRHVEKSTEENKGLNLNVAVNYGGRWDIIQGVKQLVMQVQRGTLDPKKINEESLCRLVCMNELDPVDLVIRTGGECRISNFLLWQIAYAELFFTDILWPDFDQSTFECALSAFASRDRRFGSS